MFLCPDGCEDNGGDQYGTMSFSRVALNPREKMNWQPAPSTSPWGAPRSWEVLVSHWGRRSALLDHLGRAQGLGIICGCWGTNAAEAVRPGFLIFKGHKGLLDRKREFLLFIKDHKGLSCFHGIHPAEGRSRASTALSPGQAGRRRS